MYDKYYNSPKYMKNIGCEGCTKLEYLESTGTQYIDTGIIPTSELKIYIDVQVITDLNLYNTAVFGSYGFDSWALLCSNSNINGWIIQWGNPFSNYGKKDNNRHTHIVDIFNKKYNIDGTSYDISSRIANKPSNHTIYIFGANNSNGERMTSMKVYAFSIVDYNNLVRDYIPVLDKNDRPCLFDKVSKTCFYNQGTGEFLYG